MRKTNIWIIARRAIVMALLLGTTGCVYSYYEVRVKNGQTTTDMILSCDKENGVLDVVCLNAKRTIFYPEDLSTFIGIAMETIGTFGKKHCAVCRRYL